MRPNGIQSSSLGRCIALAALPLVFAFGNTGCIKEQLISPHTQTFVNGQAQGDVPKDAVLTSSQKDDKPVTPKASSCVAVGDWLRSCGDMATAFARKADEPSKRQGFEAQANGFYNRAKGRYEQALRLDPKDMGAVLGLARVAAAGGDFAAAENHYRQVVQACPQDAGLMFELGLMYARTRQWDPALACLKRATELDPTNKAMATNYGWTLARAERFEEAWQVFRPLVGEGQAYLRLAQMAQHLGRSDLIRAYLTYAIQKDPALQEAQAMLANLDKPAPAASPVPEPGVAAPEASIQPAGAR